MSWGEGTLEVVGDKCYLSTPAGQRWEVRSFAALRRVEGDRVCFLRDGTATIASRQGPIPKGTIRMMPLESDAIILDLKDPPAGTTGHVTIVHSRERIRDFLVAAARPLHKMVPVSLAGDRDRERLIDIPLGSMAGLQCAFCERPTGPRPATDTCTYCERPTCQSHASLCRVDSELPLLEAYCRECVYFFLGLTP